jgi:ABC-2 type transport system permease protein
MTALTANLTAITTSNTTSRTRDSITMVRRRLLHLRRYPTLTAFLVGTPVLFLVLFVYVFGGALGAGVGPERLGRAGYLEYVTPAILVMAVASIAVGTAGAVAMDMTGGIVARFRTMAVAPSAFLTGHVLAALVQSVIAVVVAAGVAIGIGYRPDATAGTGVAVLGMLMLISFSLTWLTVAFGLAAKSVESATNLPMLLVLLPFLGSGFVPTDSMPAGLRWFAEYQPFTAFIESTRGLLAGAADAGDIGRAATWCVALSALGWGLARHLYARERAF